MKTVEIIASALTLVALSAQLSRAATDFHLSPKGDDSNPGSKSAPFATLQRARNAVRKLPPVARQHGVTIHLSQGTYTLETALVLTPQDSGASKNAPVTWKGEKGAVVSGGRAITGWTKGDGNIWKTSVPWLRKERPFYSLFADGQRLTRARVPDAGAYLYTTKLIFFNESDEQNGKTCLGMYHEPGDIPADTQIHDGQIVLFHNWVTSHNYVRSIDTNLNRIAFTRHAGIFLPDPAARFYIEGIRSALTSPNEWFLNSQTKELMFIPAEGQNPNKMRIIAPVVETALIQISGSQESGEKVDNLIFENISFEHTDADLTKDHRKSVQGAHYQRGAFNAEGLRNSIIRNCGFTRVGEHGICLLNGCQGNLIERNHIRDMGGGGVYMPMEKPQTSTRDNLCSHNTIKDNLIHDGGIIFRAGVGVFMGGNASYNQILNNEIFNFSWVGIHAGWSWSGLVPTATHHNEIGFNHIHHLGNGVLCDIGGIYTIGVSPGTVIHNNHIHDIRRFSGSVGYGGWGVYNDGGSARITVTSNLVYNTQDGGYHLHNHGHPWGIKAHNNIFAISDSAQLKRNGNASQDTTNGLHLVFENNIVYCTNNLVYGGKVPESMDWRTNSVYSCNYNCFHSTSDQPLDFAGHDFETWRKTGKDVNSVIADPMFKDVKNHDFRVHPLSPAITLGFKPFDYTLAGLTRGNPLRKRIGNIPYHVVEIAEIDNLPFRIDEGYEVMDPGARPFGSYATRNIKKYGFRVSAKQAATGRHSLKIHDFPGFQFAWDPHWFQRVPIQSGTWLISFDLYHTQGAKITLEIRDWPKNRSLRGGPSITVDADGAVKTDLGDFKIRSEEWTSFAIECAQGDGTRPTWTLAVNADKADEKRFSGMVSNPGFINLNWFGISMPDKKDSVVYLDNLRIELIKTALGGAST